MDLPVDTEPAPVPRAPDGVTVVTRTGRGRAADVVVAGYVVLGELGKGGMGVVYKARHVALNRLVAIKVLLGGASRAESVLRFRLEAETIARLNHPNVIGIFEVGESGGNPYCVLEYAPGGTLDDRIDKGPLGPREAAALVQKVARAVDAAHRAGVVHRDLKPANVLLTESGEPKVSDYGLAKQIGGPEGLTQTGQVMGTPSYMAPEQASGDRFVGPATDVYGLGGVLYACLSGRPPFRTGSVMKTLDEVRNKPPMPLRRLNPKVPRDLETIAAKCLHKEPARRYATAAELADDLARYLNGEPILARPTGVAERLFSAIRRRPTLAAAWAFGVLALLLAAATALVADAYRAADAAKVVAEVALAGEADQRRGADAARAALATANDALADANDISQLRLAFRLATAGDRAAGRQALARHRDDCRSWEWHLTDRLLAAPHEFTLSDGAVYSLNFSHDGTALVAGTASQAIRLVDLASGKVVLDFAGSGRPAGPAPFGFGPVKPKQAYGSHLSPDGRTLTSAAGGLALKEWDVATGKSRRETALAAPSPLSSLSLHPKRPHLAGGTAGGMSVPGGGLVHVLDRTTGKPVRSLSGHKGPVTCVDYAADDRLISGCEAGEVRVWETGDYKPVGVHRVHSRAVRAVRVRPGRPEFVSGGNDGIVFRHHLRDGNVLGSLSVGKPVSATAWSGDGATLAVGRADGAVVVQHADSGSVFEVPPPDAADDAVTALAFRRDGGAIAVGHSTGLVRVVASRPQALHAAHGLPDGGSVEHIDSGLALARTPDGLPRLYRHDGGGLTFVRSFDAPARGTSSMTFRAASKTVAMAGRDGALQVRHLDTGKLIEETTAVPGTDAPRVALSADGRRAVVTATTNANNTRVAVRHVGSGKAPVVRELPGSNSRADFSPDGLRVAVATSKVVALLDAAGLETVWEAPARRPLVVDVAFAPDGRTFAVASVVGWEAFAVGSSAPIGEARIDLIRALLFTPDGRRLFTLHPGGEIRSWVPTRGEELFHARVGVGNPRYLAWGADGRDLLLYGDTRVVQVVRAGRATLPPFVAK